LEEEEFIELIDTLATSEERTQLIEKFAHHNHELLMPHEKTLPFMLNNLKPQDRRVIENTHPEDWFIHLTTPDWEADWQSMKPFFLNQ
jgi:5,10-methenyltetrahydromethanopterin hydrogenase